MHIIFICGHINIFIHDMYYYFANKNMHIIIIKNSFYLRLLLLQPYMYSLQSLPWKFFNTVARIDIAQTFTLTTL